MKHTNIDMPCHNPMYRITNQENPSVSWFACDDCDEDIKPGESSYMMRDSYGEKHYYTVEPVDPYTVIFITGHRPPKIGGYDWNAPKRKHLRAAIAEKLISAQNKFGNILLITGGALGTDQDAAAVAHMLDIPFYLFAPCKNQHKKWPNESKEIYARLSNAADNIHFTHDGDYPGAWVLQKRNQEMVDVADYGLAVYDGSSGGTANCLEYAAKKGVKVVNIDPSKL